MDEQNMQMAETVLTAVTCAAVAYRTQYGRDAAVAAGCVEDVLRLAEGLGVFVNDEQKDELYTIVLGHDETDDVLAGIMAATA